MDRRRAGAAPPVLPMALVEKGPDPAIVAALDTLLGALDLEDLGGDRFRATSEEPRFPRVFGGQLVAQALQAATATVERLAPNSLHAYFVRGGVAEEPLDIAVERVRDGRTMATRRVTVSQGDRAVLAALVSFHDNGAEPPVAAPAAALPSAAPEELPTLQDWARNAPDTHRERARVWFEKPPPLEVRIGEPLTFLGGSHGSGTRSHWLRLPRHPGDDPRLHAVLLTYASDYFLLDLAVRNHPRPAQVRTATSSSLDHAVWLHRPVVFDRWHLCTHESLALSGERGLVRGTVQDEAGNLVATVLQEVLVPTDPGD
jgi:acyl-CoA thioesterase-2